MDFWFRVYAHLIEIGHEKAQKLIRISYLVNRISMIN